MSGTTLIHDRPAFKGISVPSAAKKRGSSPTPVVAPGPFKGETIAEDNGPPRAERLDKEAQVAIGVFHDIHRIVRNVLDDDIFDRDLLAVVTVPMRSAP